MLSGRTFESFEIHSRAGLVWKLERAHLQRFERLQILITPRTFDTYDIARFRHSPDRKIERLSAPRCDDDLVRRARSPLPKHQSRHLAAQPHVAARFLICDSGVVKCGKRKSHRSVQSS